MKNQSEVNMTLVSLPLMVIQHLLEEVRSRVTALGGTKKEAEDLNKKLVQRVWAGVELVDAKKVRFDPEKKSFFVGSSRPLKRGKRVVEEYAVSEESCECADHRYGREGDWRCAPEGRCKHIAAVRYINLLNVGLGVLRLKPPSSGRRFGSVPAGTIVLDTSYSQLPPEELSA